MNSQKKNEIKIQLINSSKIKEGRNIETYNLMSKYNSAKNFNANAYQNSFMNEDDSKAMILNSLIRKNIKKNFKNNMNRIFKNSYQYSNAYNINNDNEENYLNDIDETINKLINKFNNKNKDQKTEIILKKVRFHDFIGDNKINKNKKKFIKKKLLKAENNKEDIFQYTLPIKGVLFEKNNFSYSKYRKNLFMIENPNSTKYNNKTSKISTKFNLIEKEINSKSSLPFINNIDNKNKTQNMFFNKNNIKKKYKEINIRIRTKKDENLSNILKYKKLKNLDVISTAGSENGINKQNQDSYFILSPLDNYDEIKLIGIFNGHGENGDILSKEIKSFFSNHYNNIFNSIINNISNKKNILNNNFINNNEKNIMNHDYYSTKFSNKKIKFVFSEEKKLQNLSNLLKEKLQKVEKLFNEMASSNYLNIYNSYQKLDENLHLKYSSSNICHLSGSTASIIFLFNSRNCNKIITSNLGDSKIILISESNKIKELNVIHTLDNQEEKNRVISHGAVIKRLNTGPLRLWFKNKKYPGLSITRSFGDFESDSLGVLSVPDVKEYDLDNEQIKILIFCSDGIWRFLNNDKILNIVLPYYEQNDIKGATNKIRETAYNLWNIINPRGISDITVFILFFK